MTDDLETLREQAADLMRRVESMEQARQSEQWPKWYKSNGVLLRRDSDGFVTSTVPLGSLPCCTKWDDVDQERLDSGYYFQITAAEAERLIAEAKSTSEPQPETEQWPRYLSCRLWDNDPDHCTAYVRFDSPASKGVYVHRDGITLEPCSSTAADVQRWIDCPSYRQHHNGWHWITAEEATSRIKPPQPKPEPPALWGIWLDDEWKHKCRAPVVSVYMTREHAEGAASIYGGTVHPLTAKAIAEDKEASRG